MHEVFVVKVAHVDANHRDSHRGRICEEEHEPLERKAEVVSIKVHFRAVSSIHINDQLTSAMRV